MAIQVEQEDGSYTESNSIPTSGYALNVEKSVCSNGAKPNWNYEVNSLLITSLTETGTSCYLYFDKGITISDIKNSYIASGNVESFNLTTYNGQISANITGRETSIKNPSFTI